MTSHERAAGGRLRLASAPGRWTLVATVLGSGAVFLESTVVHVALPAIGRDLDLGIAGLQWVLDGYLLTLSALMLLGGSLGDVFSRRRVFAIGLVAFAATSAVAAIAPGIRSLVAFRLLQGAAGALLVPNSLAILDAAFAGAERGTAIGRWAGWSAISTALGPLVGGWLVDELSWRWVFGAIAPFPLAAAWIATRHIPEPREAGEGARRSVDYPGAALVTLGLAGAVSALVFGPRAGFDDPWILTAGIGGAIALAAFIAVERRARDPLLPLRLFRSRPFSGANAMTLLVYGALGALFFLLMLQLQNAMGYSALAAGAALLPFNVLMLALSPIAGRVSQRIGPRGPMTLGALVAAAGMALFTRVAPGAGYVGEVLPAVTVFGLGMATLVTPLTATVLGAVPPDEAGIASGANNAVARLAALLAVAVLPLAAGLAGLESLRGPVLVAGFVRAMWINAGLCAAGAAIALATVRGGAVVRPVAAPSPEHGCTQRAPEPSD